MPSYPCKPGCTCGRHQRKVRPESRGRKLSAEHRAKIAAAQRGRKLSPEHRANQSKGQIERYRRGREQEVDQPTEKRCTKCKKMKPVPDGYVMRKRKLATGEIRHYAAGECKECGKKRAAAWRAKMKAEGKMTEIDRRHKRTYINKDPDRYRRMQREAGAAQRRKAGVPEKGPWRKYRNENGKGGKLPLGPIQEWLVEQAKIHEITSIAAATGVSDRQIRRIITGKDGDGPVKSVSVDLADKIFHGLGATEEMAILYGDH